MRSIALLPLLLTSAVASAVPLEITHQGKLYDSFGTPLDGALTLDFSIYDDPAGTTSVWSSQRTVNADLGFYTVVLGENTPLDIDVFDGTTLYLGVAVNGGAELPGRLPLISVPYAFRAGNADFADQADHAATADAATSLAGGIVNATEVQINGVTVIDSSGTIDGSAIGGGVSDTLADLGCSDGQLAIVSSTTWTCVDESALVISAGQITGTLDILQLPMGTGNSNAAYGDHGHTAADVGALPSGGGTLTGSLSGTDADFSGSVQVGATTSSCTSGAAGTLRWDASTSELQVCDGSAWTALNSNLGGQSPGDAGADCKDLLARYPSSPDDVYWIDPNGGSSGDAFQVRCDMSGGGYTRLVTEFASYSWQNTSCGGTNDGDCRPNPVPSGSNPHMEFGQGVVGDIVYQDETGSTISDSQLSALASLSSETNLSYLLWEFDGQSTAYRAAAVYYNGDTAGPSTDFCCATTANETWADLTARAGAYVEDARILRHIDLTYQANWGIYLQFDGQEYWIR